MAFNIARTRMLTYINLGVLFLYFATITFALVRYMANGGSDISTFIYNYLIIACFLVHTMLVVHIHRNLFPNKEISRTLKTWTIVFVVLCIIVVALLVLGLIGTIILLNGDRIRPQDKNVTYIALSAIIMLIVLFTWQIVAGNNLISHITKNYRLELENSIVADP